MLRRSPMVLRGAGGASTQLSPYAQALKHVALKGSVALGPSAKEADIDMYLRDVLPPDYRPPVQGKWDDTMERWAYAWQYPVEPRREGQGGRAGRRRDALLQDPERLALLLDFSQRLLGATYSTVPGSGMRDTHDLRQQQQPSTPDADGTLARIGEGAAAAASPPPLMTAEEEAAVLAILQQEPRPPQEGGGMGEKEEHQQPGGEVGRQLASSIDTSKAGSGDSHRVATSRASSDALALCEAAQEPTLRSMMQRQFANMVPAATFARSVGLPVAYIDDGSELAVVSREFGTLLVEQLELPYDAHGCAVVISALSSHRYFDEARAVLHLAKLVGLQTGLLQDRLHIALMLGHQRQGDVNAVIAIIEDMKEDGITPSIGSWHALMTTCLNAQDFPAVQQVVDNMKAFANIEPNEATFFLQLQALARDRTRESNPHEAIQLFDQMEHVYGYIPSRRHYHALIHACGTRAAPALQTKVWELAKKMELLGIMWEPTTCHLLLCAARSAADTKRVVEVFAKMRNDGIAITTQHLAAAIETYAMALKPHWARYDALPDGKTPLMLWLDHLTVAFGIYDILLRRNMGPTTRIANALLMITTEAAAACAEVTPDDLDSLVKFEEQATAIWEKTYSELDLAKDARSYGTYVTMLARMQRIDEAEKLFQQMVLTKDMTPHASVYEQLMFMHLRSGEEGGTARALQYMDAMERAGLPVRGRLVRQFVKANEEAGYRRDMKRRARRIMQAREEYMAKKAEGVDMTPKAYEPPTKDEDGNPLVVPLPVAANSTLAWWERWKRETVSKHELFETEREDGLPRGEDFAEKNEALRKMGIESTFPTKADVPTREGHDLLRATNSEIGTGALWALDGGDLSYPRDGNGPDGWGVALWRQRQVMKKEFAKIAERDAAAALQKQQLSPLGNAARVVPDQLAIEESGARTLGELADFRALPEHVYDDGTAKPASELAAAVPPGAELVWQQEKRDMLAPFKSDSELAMENDADFFAQLEAESKTQSDAAIAALQAKREGEEVIIGRGVTRRAKYDYLAKWKEMYQHGTLEAPDAPVLRFGSTPVDHEETVAQTIRSWYKRQSGRLPPSAARVEEATAEQQRNKETVQSLRALHERRQREVRKQSAQRNDALLKHKNSK